MLVIATIQEREQTPHTELPQIAKYQEPAHYTIGFNNLHTPAVTAALLSLSDNRDICKFQRSIEKRLLPTTNFYIAHKPVLNGINMPESIRTIQRKHNVASVYATMMVIFICPQKRSMNLATNRLTIVAAVIP